MHAAAIQKKVLHLSEKMTFIAAGASITSGVTGIAAAGHTPGHMAFLLESVGRGLVLTADTANHFVASLQKPEWEVSFDMDKAAAANSRKRIFGMLADERASVHRLSHAPSVGRLCRATRYRVPLCASQLSVPDLTLAGGHQSLVRQS
jgi:glyoxylase-like metal-dependent hydrolase (beta-lactamase superfamily II)